MLAFATHSFSLPTYTMNTRILFGRILPVALLTWSASAATVTFTGPGAGTATNPLTGSFNAPANWVGDVLPTFDETTDLSFNFTTGTATAVTATNDLGTISLNSISMLNNKAAITLTGGTLNLVQDTGASQLPSIAILAGSNQLFIVNSTVTLGANATFTNAGTAQMQFGSTGGAGAGNIDLGANSLTINGSGAYQFGASTGADRAVITGTGGITVNVTTAASTIAFFGASTFSGGLTHTAGTLVVGVSSTGAAGSVTNGAFGTGVLTINGGQLRATTNGNRTVLNDVTIGGDFILGDSGGTAKSVTLGGAVTLTGNRVLSVISGATGVNNTITGIIGDGGGGFGYTKAGSGSLVVSGANTYTGATTIRNGGILFGASVVPSVAGPLGNAASAVTLGDASTVAADNLAIRAAVDGLTFGRDIVVNAQNTTGSSALGGLGDVGATFTGGVTMNKTTALSSQSATKVVGFSGVMSGVGGVTKTDLGAVRLSGLNTFTGATTVRRGTLLVAGNALVSTDGALGNAASNVALADGTSGAADNVALAIDGAFTIARGITVNGNNSTGTSTLTATNAAATTATYSGGITLGRANTILANATSGATTAFTGVIGGANGVTINGPGIVEFSGAAAHAYTGTTTVASGTLRLNGATGLILGDGNTATVDMLITGGTLLWAANSQLATNATVQMSSGTLDVGGFSQTIFDLDYTGGAILNAGGLTITNGTDLFLFDGTNIGATTLGRKLLYAGQTTAGTVSGALALDTDAVHEFGINDGAAATDATISGVISNETTASTFTKRGLGTLLLNGSAANTFGGAGNTVTVEGGILAITNDNQLGDAANTLTFTGGAVRFDGAGTTARTMNLTAAGGGVFVATGDTKTLSAQLSGATGVFTKSGPGTLVMAADQSATWTGNAALAAGTLSVSAENQLGALTNDITLQGGTLEVTASFNADAGKVVTLGAGGGGINVAAGQTLGLDGAAQLVGNSVLTKTGNGTLRIGAANATLAAGAGVSIAAGTVELRNAQSLGSAPKAAVTMSGGTLALRNDVATSFSNPITVTANSNIESDVLTPGVGVTHTLGTLSIGSQTLSFSAGAGTTSGTAGVTFGTVALTGNANFAPGANVSVASGIISGTATLTKSGVGTLVLAAGNTFTGNTEVTAGTLRVNSTTALGNNANTVRVSGGTMLLGATVNADTYALEIAGGTIASTGANRDWLGRAGATPSITFMADTTFDLADPFAPTTARDINFGATTLGNTGTTTSTVPVNIVVNAPVANATTGNKLRFRNFVSPGSVTGTLTVNPNAIAQIRAAGAVNGFGSSEIRLNTGFNATTALSTGRFEFISEVDATFGNNVVVLGDSAIGVGRVSAAANKILTAGNLTIGATTLAIIDTGGTNTYRLAFAGTTTLSASPTLFTQTADMTLNAVAESGAGGYTVTKTGGKILTLNGPGSWTGGTTITAGSLVLGASGVLADAAPISITGGSLNVGGFSETVGTVTLTGASSLAGTGTLTTQGLALGGTATYTASMSLAGTGGLVKSGTGTVTLSAANSYTGTTSVTGGFLTFGAAGSLVGDLSVDGGTAGIGVDNAISDTSNVVVNSGQFNFYTGTNAARSETLASLTLINGLVRTVQGTVATPSLINITGTLNVAGGDFALNSGSSMIVNKAIFGGPTNIHVIGGNSAVQINELTVGAGGLEFTGANLRMNNGPQLGSRLNLNGDLTTFAAPTEAGFFGESGTGTGTREITLGAATRTFTVADGAVLNDLRIDFPLVGTLTPGSNAIIKDGPGKLLLAGVNTITGDTTILDGTLMLSGSLSGSHIIVEGGTLAGIGTAGAITVNGGTLAPGASIGTMPAASLALNGGGTFALEIDTNFVSADLVSLGGNLTLSTSVAPMLTITDLGGNIALVPENVFTFITYGGTWNGGIFNVAGVGPVADDATFIFGANEYKLDYNAGGNSVALITVPEPTTPLLILGGLAFLARRRRK